SGIGCRTRSFLSPQSLWALPASCGCTTTCGTCCGFAEPDFVLRRSQAGSVMGAAVSEGKDMAARLRHVLYWAGGGLAAIIVIFGFFVVVNETKSSTALWVAGFFAAAGGIIWLIGAACRYVLAGPRQVDNSSAGPRRTSAVSEGGDGAVAAYRAVRWRW